jgi:putative DNA methylase
VLFAQLVDDPSAHPDQFPTEEDQAVERKRLFEIIERLVVWENAGDERLLREAHAEIAKCFDGKRLFGYQHGRLARRVRVPLAARSMRSR